MPGAPARVGERKLGSCVLRPLINDHQPRSHLLLSLTAFDLDTVKLLMALFVGLEQAPVLATHHLTYIWTSGYGSQWNHHI